MRGIPKMRLISFIFFLVGTVCMLIGFFTSFWYKRRDQNYNILIHHGLWILCDYWFDTENKCIKIAGTHYTQLNGRMRAVQGMMCISVILAAVTLPLYVVWMLQPNKILGTTKAKRVAIATMSFCMMSGIFNMLGVLIFGAHYSKFEYVLNWSYFLAAGGAAFNTFNGIGCLISSHCCNKDSFNGRDQSIYDDKTRALHGPYVPTSIKEEHDNYIGREEPISAEPLQYSPPNSNEPEVQTIASNPPKYSTASPTKPQTQTVVNIVYKVRK